MDSADTNMRNPPNENTPNENPPNGDSVDPPTPWLNIQSRPVVPHAKMPVERTAVYYNMNHKKRGIAIILNHEHFRANLNLRSRSGTNLDSKKLENTLQGLGFDPWSYYDRSLEEVHQIIAKASTLDHSDHDALIVVVLTHGEQGILYANDGVYKPDSLWLPFTADKCKSLAGKPKLFFIQACQGDKLDSGVIMRPTETDSGTGSYKIPIHADFLIAYSTIPGYYSWRNTSKGSWFMQALCEELNENGFLLDLLTIMTFVNQRVAFDFESNTPDNPGMHQQKQIPCITYMLTRLVKFTRKQN
ncbi:caspase-1-like isoform X2 [Thrips palmi]|uniref:Caspase-1-like isoform X2 n=1 Tax=Thrips palmi TaxID=161013 RepID=A0A6P8Z5Q8_THRPL|nr:caspase-1-like isoform X2 [Thrips palmi]XP_034245436.1 caspase-1-like isoform X2 [Thrips palmi]